MIREIGSEFWDIPINIKVNNIIPNNIISFISGTSALEFILHDILKHYKVTTVAIPSWCCSCMIAPFLKCGFDVKFYSVFLDNNNNLICDYDSVKECDITLVISYFGYSGQINKGYPSGIIIRDLTHSIFNKISYDADYYFGSLRKWAGFITGGFAFSERNLNDNIRCRPLDLDYIKLRQKAMIQKKLYIDGVSNSKDYLKLFEQGEDFLDKCDIICGYDKDLESFKKLDINFIRRKRQANAKILLSAFKEKAIFKDVRDDDCPLFVPIILLNKTRSILRKKLIERQIYCPIHWPISSFHKLNSKTSKLYETELSLVCDQRYSEDDMNKIVQTINNILGDDIYFGE